MGDSRWGGSIDGRTGEVGEDEATGRRDVGQMSIASGEVVEVEVDARRLAEESSSLCSTGRRRRTTGKGEGEKDGGEREEDKGVACISIKHGSLSGCISRSVCGG